MPLDLPANGRPRASQYLGATAKTLIQIVVCLVAALLSAENERIGRRLVAFK